MATKRGQRVLEAVAGTVWPIMPEKLEAILDVVEFRLAGIELTDEEIQQRVQEAHVPTYAVVRGKEPTSGGKVAVIPLMGVLTHRANLFSETSGMTSLDQFRKRVEAAASDPDVRAIVLDVDSPGGAIAGVPETAAVLRDVAAQKRVVAVSNALMASAAYWLGAQATEVVVTPSGQAGSVGVFAVHADESKAVEQRGIKFTLVKAGKYKAEGMPFEPLSEEARAALQTRVDEVYGMFVKDLAKGRGVSTAKVEADFGQGRVVSAQDAVDKGMADRIGTLQAELERLGVGAVGVGNVRRTQAQAAHYARMLALADRERVDLQL